MIPKQTSPHENAASIPPVVVMGVSGSGKSVVGSALAEALGALYIEGDLLHPEDNVERMAAGTPLTDADRAGWLDAIGAEIVAHSDGGAPVVIGCSALKRRYRDRLRAFSPALVFVHLALDPATARHRVLSRTGHFMPPSLVDSQFADLEPPQVDETALSLDALLPVGSLVSSSAEFLRHIGEARPVSEPVIGSS